MALKYLMNSCDDMAAACDKNIDSLDSKKTIKDLEKNFGNLFASIKEVVEEFKLNEEKVFAELIVREMLQTCEDHPAWTGRMIGEEIKEYFGVEE